MDVNINNSTPTNAETMKIVAEAKKIEQQTIQVIHIWHNTFNTSIYFSTNIHSLHSNISICVYYMYRN
jgi:hypothetical protein